MNPIKSLFIALLSLSAVATAAQSAEITGAGATFPYPIYAKWADEYKKETAVGLNYQSIGSGAGIKQIQAKTVTFGATDAPLTAEELKKSGLVQWPMVMGGIVPIVNIPNINPGELVLDGPTLAKIYLGTIESWSDPAIVKLNPSLNLPNIPIVVVRRSDGSGTTFNFTDYLSKVSQEWKDVVGAGATTVEWPRGYGARGNDGVAGNVGQTRGSIGYVEYAYAKQNKLSYADMINKSGKRVSPNLKSFQSAASNANWSAASGFYQILTNQPGNESWPIAAATFILMHAQPQNKTDSAEALKYFAWAYAKGPKMAEELDYVPMPASVSALVQKTWSEQIKTK
jgi:phosphate transport system substrate-binding protein